MKILLLKNKIMNEAFPIILMFSFFLVSCSQFGENPSGDDLEKIKISIKLKIFLYLFLSS